MILHSCNNATGYANDKKKIVSETVKTGLTIRVDIGIRGKFWNGVTSGKQVSNSVIYGRVFRGLCFGWFSYTEKGCFGGL